MNFNLDLNEHDAAEISAAVNAVILRQQYIDGPEVAALEKEFAARTGRSHAIAVGSGTDAIYIALKVASIGPGDEVITSAFGPAYTALAIAETGATPIFADVEPDSLAIDPYHAESLRSSRTRAIIPVHFFGDRRPYPGGCLLEDAAQVSPGVLDHPAEFTAFSCYPTKNLGAWGEAGMLVTDDGWYANIARMRRDSGRSDRYTHHMDGLNMAMDEIQAAVLRVKLRTLTLRDERRRNAAAYYFNRLRGLRDIRTFWTPTKGYAPHLFVIQTPHRDRIMEALKNAGIPTLMHYPIAVPDQPVFQHVGEWPVARKAASEVLSLPFFPDIKQSEQERVIYVIANCLS